MAAASGSRACASRSTTVRDIIWSACNRRSLRPGRSPVSSRAVTRCWNEHSHTCAPAPSNQHRNSVQSAKAITSLDTQRRSQLGGVGMCVPVVARRIRRLGRRHLIPSLLLTAVVKLTTACHAGAARQISRPALTTSRRIANLLAFARLYVVVRWFHPSDAAAVIDWDRFAVDGARRVIDAPDPRALRTTLAELIAPFAPTVHLAATGESFL